MPVIQIVHETVRDALSGRKSSRPAAAASAGMNLMALGYCLSCRDIAPNSNKFASEFVVIYFALVTMS